MNNLDKKMIISYITAGDPDLKTTEECIISMQEAGSDVIVLGVPFSDPIAESKEIQDSNIRALNSKTYTKDIFAMLEKLNLKDITIVLYTYMNPLFCYGYDAFCKKCQEVGVKGLMFADMPFEEKEEIEPIASKYNIDIIMNSPFSSKERIQTITKDAKGFIGIFPQRDNSQDMENCIRDIKEVNNIPVCMNIDLLSKDNQEKAIKFADGIMSACQNAKILKIYGKQAPEHLFNFITTLKERIKGI